MGIAGRGLLLKEGVTDGKQIAVQFWYEWHDTTG